MVGFSRYISITIIRDKGLRTESRQETRAGGDIHTRLLLHSDIVIKRGDEIHAKVLDEPRVVVDIRPFVPGGEVSYYEVFVIPISEHVSRTPSDQASPDFSPQLVAVVSNQLERMLDEREIDLPKFLGAYGLESASDQDSAQVGDPDVYLDGLLGEELIKLIEAMLQEFRNPIYPSKKPGIRISSLGQLPKRLHDEGFDIQGDRLVPIVQGAQPSTDETPVPQEHKYHAFISYRRQEPDKSFARGLLRDLENTGYTVAIDERDFDANASFLQEMERCIKESDFTLCVVSPRYFQSGNCEEEAVICKVLDMAERKRRLVPLILDAVKMPVWMYDIVGIDFTDKDPLVPPFEKLVKTLGKP